VLENAETYGLDTEKLFAVGDSAGAHILSLYLDICTNPDYAGNYKFHTPEALQIRAVALNCGQYHMGEKELDELTGKLMEEYLPGKGTKQELQLLCADDYVTEKFPPAFIMTAEEDFLRNQAPLMYEKLKSMHIIPRKSFLRITALHIFGCFFIFLCNILAATIRMDN
jgi:acetyl esterase/lipase